MFKAIGMPHKIRGFIAAFYCKERIIYPLVNILKSPGNIGATDCGKFGARIGD